LAYIDIARQSARGTIVLFVGRLISTGLATVTTIILARLLGPDGLGLYALVLLIPNFIALFIGFGVDVAVTRFAALNLSRGDSEAAKRMAVNAIFFIFLTGVILTIASFAIGTYLSLPILHRTGLSSLVQLASFFVLTTTLFQLGNALFMGWSSMGFVSVTTVIQSAVRLAVAPVLLLIGLGVYGAVLAHVISYLFSGLIGIMLFYTLFLRRFPAVLGSFVRDVRMLVAYALPIYAGAIVSGVSQNYITIILAAIASNAIVGYYQAALWLVIPIGLTSTVISVALLPGFARLQGVQADTSLAFRYATKYVAYLTAPIVMLVVAVAGPLTIGILGDSYAPAVPYLRLLALSSLPIIIGLTVTPPFLNGIGKTRITFLLNGLSALTTVAFASLLSLVLGLATYGLVYALIFSNLVTAIIGLSLLSKYLHAGIDVRPVALILTSSLFASGSVYLISLVRLPDVFALVLQAIVFILVYLICVPLLHALGHDDFVRLEVAIEGLGVFQKLLKRIISFERIFLRIWN
jgi:O-antigen/teichoic acid export membrane protein